MPGWPRRRVVARSGGGPIRGQFARSFREGGSAGGVALDFAGRPRRSFGVSTDRCASRLDRSSSSGEPGSGSSAQFRDDRSPRSPPGAEASAAQARSRRLWRRSDGESLAPLGSTTSEHAASALRRHSGHEAMLALARALLGLIRPLRHGCVPFPRSTFTVRAINARTAGVSPACAADTGGPSRSVRDSTGGPVVGQTPSVGWSPTLYLSLEERTAHPWRATPTIYRRLRRPGAEVPGARRHCYR